MNTKLLGAIAALTLASGATASHAATWLVNFSGHDSHNFLHTGNLVLTTADTLDLAGGYDILGASGTIDSIGILGLAPPGTAGTEFVDASGAFYGDNVLFFNQGNPYMSDNGDVYWLPGDVIANTYAGSPSNQNVANGDPNTDTLMFHFPNSTYSEAVPISFNVTQLSGPVPEPNGWVFMIIGFGGLGAVLRNHRRRAIFA